MDIFETFNSIFGAKFIRTNIVSPLWIYMNFELCYDKVFNEFLPIGDDNSKGQDKVRKTKLKLDESIERIAVVFFQSTDYTSNTKKLLGHRWREVHCLKLEGYKVILIDFFEWSRMSMRNDESKLTYIKKLFEEQGINLDKIKKKSYQTDFSQNMYVSPFPEIS